MTECCELSESTEGLEKVDPAKPISQLGKWRQILAAFLLSCSGVLYGMTMTYTAVAAPSWTDDLTAPFNMTSGDISLHASIVNLGSILGALTSGTLVSMFGPKNVAAMSIIPYVGAWMLLSYPNSHIMVFSGRALSGLFVDLRSLSVLMYINEFASKELRGRLQSLVALLQNVGSIITYVLGMYMGWHALALVNVVLNHFNVFLPVCLPIPFALACLYFPDSPSSLLEKKKPEEALKSFRWYRGNLAEHLLLQEFQEKKDDLARKKAKYENGMKDLLSPLYLRPLLIALSCVSLRQFCGIFSILSFTVAIFAMTESSLSPHVASIMSASAQLVAQVGSSSVADKYGRKRLSIASCIICAVGLVSFGIYEFLKERDEETMRSFGIIPIVCLMAVMFGNGLGLYNLHYSVPLEVLPAKIRTQGFALTSVTNCLTRFFVIEFFYKMTNSGLRFYGTFWLYGACALVLSVVIGMFVPESKGLSLAEVERRMSENALEKIKRKKSIPTISIDVSVHPGVFNAGHQK